MLKEAILSDDGLYRYKLTRQWAERGGTVCFVMVNPSTADHRVDDATIRKCLGFAQRWRFGRLTVVNLFAYRATNIKELFWAQNIVGLRNTAFIKEAMWSADRVVVAWGALSKMPKDHRSRWRIIPKLAQDLDKPLVCLGTCKDGHPRHPLMVSYKQPVLDWCVPKQKPR